MGTYTRLAIEITLQDIDSITDDILKELAERRADVVERVKRMSTHPLFDTTRFEQLFDPKFIGGPDPRPSSYAYPMVFINTEIKNHEKVLEKFLSWIAPFTAYATVGTYNQEGHEDFVTTTIVFSEGKFYIQRDTGDGAEDSIWGSASEVIV